MKQRLGIALAILGNPELLILDEPINGLNPIGVVEMRKLILKLNKEKNMTIIISSHILSELSSVATCYGFLEGGHIIQEVFSKDLPNKSETYLDVSTVSSEETARIIEKNLSHLKTKILSNNIIRIFNFKNDLYQIFDTLNLNGVIINSINTSSYSLEDYFMSLVGGEK